MHLRGGKKKHAIKFRNCQYFELQGNGLNCCCASGIPFYLHDVEVFDHIKAAVVPRFPMASLPPPPNGYSACRAVIGDAINRCRYVDTLSRVTIAVKHLENNPASLLSLFQVSISDTGRGISCEEVSMLYECFSSAYPTHFCAPLFWEGELLIITTEFMEEEVRQYQINDAFYKPRIMQLRSLPKESGRYCGTNITLHLKGYPEKLLLYIHDICRKMEILMLKNVVVEVCNARLPMEGSIHEDVLLLSEGLSLPPELSNLERLSVGLANHVLNCLDEENGLPSVSKRTSLKIGKALAGSSETATERIWFFEVCFVVTEAPNIDDTSTSMRQVETKVLFFQDFLCASITPTIVQSLKTKVNWENFGLRIKSIRLDDFGMAIIEWENLSRFDSIGLVLHRYRSNQTRTIPWSREANLLKKSVEESLNDMKQKFPHLFLSHRSIEV